MEKIIYCPSIYILSASSGNVKVQSSKSNSWRYKLLTICRECMIEAWLGKGYSHYWFWIMSLWIGDTANWITELRRIPLSCTRDPNYPLYPSHFVITAIQLLRAPTTSRWLRHTRIPCNSVTLEFSVTLKPNICGWLQWPGTTGD